MDARGYFQSKSAYMNASHVADGELNLTIGNVQLETMPRDGEEKWVIYFQDHERGIAAQQDERRYRNHGIRP